MSAIGTASARIVRPLAIASLTPLRFGSLRSRTGGHVTITASPPHQRRKTGDVVFDDAISYGAAAFLVSGEANATYRILLPETVEAHAEGIVGGLKVDDLHAATTAGLGEIGRIGAEGRDRFWIGGRLEVPPNTPDGNYSALVEVQISYQ